MTCRNWFVGTLTSMILVSATLAVHGQEAQVKKFGDASDPPIHGFSVALVLGEMQGTSTSDNVPTSAKKALADLRDFLPFKSYRLLDTQWILCCGSSKTGGVKSSVVSGRLRGFEDQLYSFVIDYGYTAPKLSIRFWLREEPFAKKLPETKPPAELVDSMAQKQQEKDTKSAVIDSTFSMDVGETVVIGTSSLKADKALIAVLTAARRPGTQTTTAGDKR